MTTDDEGPELPIVTETHALAEKIATSMVDYLATLGWDYAMVSIARRIDLDAKTAVAPGATAMHCDRRRMAAALDNEAAALRKMADQLDSLCEPAAIVSSYVQDKSDYASERKQWPR